MHATLMHSIPEHTVAYVKTSLLAARTEVVETAEPPQGLPAPAGSSFAFKSSFIVPHPPVWNRVWSCSVDIVHDRFSVIIAPSPPRPWFDEPVCRSLRV